jgi:hypothetical protein
MKYKTKKKLDKWFFISWRKLWILVVGGFVSILLHNIISALFNFEEVLFFIIVVFLIPSYFIFILIYSLIKLIFKKIK